MSNTDFQNGFAMGYSAGGVTIISPQSDTTIQADYEQNDASAADYIKNRPFYEEFQTTAYDPANIIEGDDMNIIPSSALDVMIGDVVQYEILQNGETLASGETVVLDGEEVGFSGHGLLYISETINEDDVVIMVIDKLSAIFEPSNTESIAGLPYSDIMIKISSGVVKKIDKKFLPDDIATKLEIATPDILGGVQPVAKNDSMTQEVGIDENGRLYIEPAQEYTLPVASSTSLGGIYTTQTYNENKHTLNTAMVNDKLYVEKPSIAEAVTEDPGIAPSCAAVYTFIENCFKEATY